MPAISIIFNRFLSILLVQVALILPVHAQISSLSDLQLQWLGDRIFQNECNARFECLTAWNSGEDFPSLGIGHFIWFQADQQEPFTESFPALLAHYRAHGYQLPQWLDSQGDDSPWTTRQQFLDEFDSVEMQSLRRFLADTTAVQVDFIVQTLHDSVPTLTSGLDDQQSQAITGRFNQLARLQPPYGIYALVDYVHFKGSGSNPGERYQGQGWGLLQVLQQMQGSAITLDGFVTAASVVLQRRVSNAPAQRNEQRWLAGWNNRLQTYLPAAAELRR